jgi:hypothetical protein
MFCENFSPHKSKYGHFSSKNTTKGKHINATESSILNKTSVAHERQYRPETHLTRECWQQIRHSPYYAKDYEAFSKISSGPFIPDLYFSYPPPQNAI